MDTLWQKRVPLDPTFAPLNNSLTEDWFLLPYELKLQRAHARALSDAGILSPQEQNALEEALAELGKRWLDAPCPEAHAEDLHTWIEDELTRRVGAAGQRIHTARSRNDQVATLLKLYLIDAGDRLTHLLCDLVRIGCVRAREWSDWAFPLQTHTQFAAPGSIGFWVLRYAVGWSRLLQHGRYFTGAWRRHCPLGSGAVAGSSIPIDRTIQARELGFDQPSANALDSTSTRDECVEYLALATQTALLLQSLATDVIAFSQTPFGWVQYPAAFGTGSSMMPNKVNPDAMELLRGESCALAAAHHHAVTLLKGLPSGYNRDLQCIKPVVHDASVKLEGLLRMTSAFLAELEFNRERLAESLRLGGVDATWRMEELVRKGMPLREAHHAVASEHHQPVQPHGHVAADLSRYATTGSARPEETRRVAAELLAWLETPAPR